VVPMGYYADQRLPADSFARALWSLSYLIAGVLLLITSQVWAVHILRFAGEIVGWGDIINPARLWGMTWRGLPATAWPIGLGSAGALAILVATVWVGGFSWWLRVDLGTQAAVGKRTKETVAENMRKTQRELERLSVSSDLSKRNDKRDRTRSGGLEGGFVFSDSVKSTLSTNDSQITSAKQSPDADARPTEKCVVIGFVPASGGQPAGLVLAALREGKLAYAGIVRKGVDETSEMMTKLSALTRARPLIEGLNLDAVWVKPELFCEVHQSGVDRGGSFVDPKLKGLIED
ncbi:MAG: hypothetical protein ACRD36_13680, partial [Candidatus Acidiferrum sp.]